ncbi:Transcriptional enhancer factor TEF-1 [Galemys pyrenaicus]|uniref:Transcriptional enhancer factor TEF-1 n=1 Tax=Galemys pyrenaicus TaxID=202257 RepID=A0A8J6DXF0_GALPY|nr:Transcriptional enhancer factor TEF-1 [Galemys pyrenaicus]
MHPVLSLCVTVTLKDQTAKDKALQHMAAMSSAQIVSATAIHNKLGLPGIPRPTFPGAPGVSQEGRGQRSKTQALRGAQSHERRALLPRVVAVRQLCPPQPHPFMAVQAEPGLPLRSAHLSEDGGVLLSSILLQLSLSVKPFVQQAYPIPPAVTAPIPGFEPASAPAPSVPAWQGRSIGTTKLRLVEFSAFLEQQRDPDSVSRFESRVHIPILLPFLAPFSFTFFCPGT